MDEPISRRDVAGALAGVVGMLAFAAEAHPPGDRAFLETFVGELRRIPAGTAYHDIFQAVANALSPRDTEH